MKVRPLKGFGAFDAILKYGTKVTVGPVGLTVLVNSTGLGGATSHTKVSPVQCFTVGVAIGKRSAPLAVSRSRVRRLLRVASKSAITRDSTQLLDAGITAAIVIWRYAVRNPAEITLAEVQPAVDLAFRQMFLRLSNRTIHPIAGAQ